jgi:type IV secretory pathway protease TraF
MTGRAAILLTLLGSATVLRSTIAAKPVSHFIWNASESVPIGL